MAIPNASPSPIPHRLQEIDEDEGIAAVHEAFALGINFFDTSPFYGITRSESVLGRALRGLPRDRIIVASKVGRYGPEEFDFRYGRTLHSPPQPAGLESSESMVWMGAPAWVCTMGGCVSKHVILYVRILAHMSAHAHICVVRVCVSVPHIVRAPSPRADASQAVVADLLPLSSPPSK